MSARRIKEIMDLKKNLPEYCIADPRKEDINVLDAVIMGPTNCPYHGGIFRLEILFPPDFPLNPPKVTFITKIYHPNVNSKGEISLDILNDKWSHELTIRKVLLSICSLLTDANPKDSLMPEIAEQFMNKRSEFDDTARMWTQLYATE